ncbi:MAG: TetR/AcrR family transcriptional regulator [Clostridia bacterium]|nr:TetR/AcrR family transcriptional regulator [Clostridia bacterium]
MSIKEAKKNFIVDVAAGLYLSRGIFTVTIKDVADEAGVGEATVYRYFSTKRNLVVAVGEKLATDVRKKSVDPIVEQTGYEKIRAFFMCFSDIYRSRPELYRFVSDFDVFVQEEEGDLGDYEKSVFDFFLDFSSAYKQGREDGTVREIENLDLYYLTTTHALLGLCKKLAAGRILSQDKYGAEEVETLVDIVLTNIKQTRV